MRYADFTEEMCNDIKDAVKTSLLKLGIDTEVYLSADTYDNGKDRLFIETGRFNTTPVIYKSIFVRGSGTLREVEGHKGVYDLYIPLDYRFEYFSGGTNGVTIGVIYFRVFEENKRIACIGLTI